MKSDIKIKGVAGVNLTATEQGTHDQIGKYLIVPDATTNLLFVLEPTKYGIVVHFFDNKAILEISVKQHYVKESISRWNILHQK